LFKLLKKYAPETDKEKSQRIKTAAANKTQGKQVEGKKPVVLKYGLNHITTLVENKQAKLVVIAHNVDPVELVLWLPQLCRKNNVPFCFVRGKAELGNLVHKKTATAVAITDVRGEDKSILDQFTKNFKAAFSDNEDLRKKWGGGLLGIKSQHQIDLLQAAKDKEALKKAKL
jgi:large subunit ribosomal protein L7Ae